VCRKSRSIETFLWKALSRRYFAACVSFLCGLKNVREKYRRDRRVIKKIYIYMFFEGLVVQ
jgi:hypothetical protein